MATIINTRTFFQSQAKVILDVYSNTSPMKKIRWTEFFNSDGTYAGEADRSFWQALSIIGFGTLALRQEGQAATIDASKEGLLSFFPKVTFALRYIVTKEMAREDKKRLIPKLPPFLRYSNDQTKEYLFWNVLNLGFLNKAAGGYNLADGQPLFSNNHPCTGNPSLTFSNYLGPVSLTVESLNQAFVLLAAMPDDRGLLTYRTPRELVYPIGLHQKVVETLSSFYYPTDDRNAVNSVAGSLTPRAVEYLAAPQNGPYPWFVTAGKGELGTDAHTAFASIAWDEQRSYVNDDNLSLVHETEFRASWGAVTGYGIVGSAGA